MKHLLIALAFLTGVGFASAQVPGMFQPLLMGNTCIPGTVIFLTSGSGATWSNTTGCTNFTVEAIGGGGGGSGGLTNIRAGSGAGAGGYSKVTNLGISGSATYTVGA